MNVISVEIPVKDIERAVKFYGALFNQELKSAEYDGRKYAGIKMADGQVSMWINQFEGFEPSNNGPLVYLNAGNQFDAMLVRIEQAGGKVVIPRTPMSDTSVFSTFNDTEGNTLGLYAEV